MKKKASNLILRVSDEWKKELKRICWNKGRTMTGHVEHSLELAKLVTEFCGGNDDLEYIRQYLNELKSKKEAERNIPPSILLAAETAESPKLPSPTPVNYEEKKNRDA